MTSFTFILSWFLLALCSATIQRPRGVAISMASFYKPGTHFRCLDGSKEVPFEYVNDDYCDCPDASDEPGTSACPTGKFHCTNAGYKPTNILSSRVNDGICDCCDGTDEWGGNIDCVNNCKELGKKLREEMDQTRKLQEEGYKAKVVAMETGKKLREEKKQKLIELEKSKFDLEVVKEQMEEKKNEAEGPETEAKDKHEKAWQEELERKKALAEHARALVAFKDMDTNDDEKLHFTEIKSQGGFDIDSNGEVSDEEAKEHLEGEEHVEFDQFIEKVWPNVKQFYKPADQQAEQDAPDTQASDIHTPDDDIQEGYSDDDLEEDDEDDEDEYDEEDEAEREQNRTGEKEEKEGEGEERMPDYDEETKKLIEIANTARSEYSVAESKLKETETEISSLNNYLSADYGPDEEFSSLKGECFEYTDREYTYKLCGYEKASQRPKNGGVETTLGNWGKWDGPADDKYAAQKYENGLSCWNGPNRSVKVNLKCGMENKLVNAFEPSRCEYEFDFITPSRCSEPSPATNPDSHDEL